MKGTPIASSEIFEEVPIRIHNAPLARALLLEMQEKKVAVPVDFDRLDLTSSAFLEKKMRFSQMRSITPVLSMASGPQKRNVISSST